MLLKNYYLNKGFYEAQITSSNVEYTEGEGFILSYTINAGKKYNQQGKNKIDEENTSLKGDNIN